MTNNHLKQLRNRIDEINLQILELLNERTELVEAIGQEKDRQGLKKYDPIREQQIIEQLKEKNQGPMTDEMMVHIFKEIFKVSVKLQEEKSHKERIIVSRKKNQEDTVIEVNGDTIGSGEPTFVFGPCSVESREQMERVAANLAAKGLKYIRGGAFKPRTSPYDFQGLGVEGLKIINEVAKKYNLRVISEIMDASDLEASITLFRCGSNWSTEYAKLLIIKSSWEN